jgi:hypothetical protein
LYMVMMPVRQDHLVDSDFLILQDGFYGCDPLRLAFASVDEQPFCALADNVCIRTLMT